MRSLSITTRVILAYTLVFGLLLASFGVIIYRSSYNEEIATLDGRLEHYAAAIQAEVGEGQGDESPTDARRLLSVHGEGLTGARFQLYAPDGGKVVRDSVLSLLPGSGGPDSTDAPGRHFTANIQDIPYRILRTQVEIEEHGQYGLEVAAPMTEADDRLSRLRLLLLTAIPSSLFLAAIAAFLITRTALRPIAAMTETARSITASSLDRRIPIPGAHDEVRVLAETLNGMIERIDSALQSQRQFVADASHELRTPLTILTTELEYAEQRTTKEARESMQIALAEVGRLTRLIDGLLLLARLDAPHMSLAHESVSLDKLLEECVQQMSSAAARKHITLRLLTDNSVVINGDRTRLKSVFLNLLDNGIAYSNERTTVTAEVGAGDPNKRQVAVSIKDEGYGIAPEDLDHIFQRFYRASAARSNERGSGLGLAIADRIVRFHGGRIDVASSPGKGSIFTVFLPLQSRP
jgi:signal transduction histidine kinase